MKLFKSSDPWTSVVILLTVGLFSLSLAVKGFTHELFLEAGVFLVSVKLILMGGKNAALEERIERHLSQIQKLLTASATGAMKEENFGGKGDDAPGGARSYIEDGKMTGGYAILATPVKYAETGIMTFMTGVNGVVYERDLGPDTSKLAASIQEFNPTDDWSPVE